MKVESYVIEVETGCDISVHNITPRIQELIEQSSLVNGFVTVTSQHTTTALAINENEARLIDDIQEFLRKLVPPDNQYRHNDIHLRDCPPDEPKNAHSHLVAMLLGSSEVIPLREGDLGLGQWQSVMLFELDGPRMRKVSVQIYGDSN